MPFSSKARGSSDRLRIGAAQRNKHKPGVGARDDTCFDLDRILGLIIHEQINKQVIDHVLPECGRRICGLNGLHCWHHHWAGLPLLKSAVKRLSMEPEPEWLCAIRLEGSIKSGGNSDTDAHQGPSASPHPGPRGPHDSKTQT
eukprot:5588723-Amphidinium_carterae.1